MGTLKQLTMYMSRPNDHSFENSLFLEMLSSRLPQPLAYLAFMLLAILKKMKEDPVVSAVLLFGIVRVVKEIVAVYRQNRERDQEGR